MIDGAPLALVRLLVAVARANGVLHPMEVEVLSSFLRDVDVSRGAALRVDEIEHSRHVEDLLPELLALGSPEVVLTLCLRIAYADGEYCAAERAMLTRIAAGLGAAGKLDALEQGVRAEFTRSEP